LGLFTNFESLEFANENIQKKTVTVFAHPFTINILPEKFRHRIKNVGRNRFGAGILTNPYVYNNRFTLLEQSPDGVTDRQTQYNKGACSDLVA